MKFIRIKKIKDIKQGDSVVISNGELEKKECTSLLFGKALYAETDLKGEIVSVNISIADTLISDNISLTNNTLKIQNVYKVILEDEKIENIDTKTLTNKEVELSRKLRKSQKLNNRLQTILDKRFGITKEMLDLNFKKKKNKKSNNFVPYKTMEDAMPRVDITGRVKNLYTTITFSSNGKDSIKCELTIYKSKVLKDVLLVVDALSICHKEDNFNKEAGELIAYNKAYAKAICEIH